MEGAGVGNQNNSCV